jgi:pyruvate-ferredoxin/flavodoxin oxidoreductase
MSRVITTIDGNEATAAVAHRLSEVIAIYPITPSSAMGEFADQWSAEKKTNIWGTIPTVVELQSEGGAAGALHGAMQAGALTTTFTASQGLLLMIPNMYKIAGELTPAVLHVSARTVATHALSIFGDHSDVMAVRATGFALLSSNSVQEAHDLAAIAHAATLESRIPFLHFFDGFRISHEVAKLELLSDDDLRSMINHEKVQEHRARAMTPDRPVLRGTAQNPDAFFQARETVNTYYEKCPEIVQQIMDRFASLVGRQYNLFDYVGAPDAERVIVMMGSAADTAEETARFLNKQGEKVGVLKVRLYRPFSAAHFVRALPATVKTIATLDRTKEPGASGEPLYKDVITGLAEGFAMGAAAFGQMPRVFGGRYGLSSKDFTPGMAKAVFDEMQKESPRNHFTIGIQDDVTHTSLNYDPLFNIESEKTVRCVFWGLGADGTVGANKNSIKIIGEETENHAQGYFVYDSKKSGAVTVSHLRFGPDPIKAHYLVNQADFVACHQFSFLERFDVLKYSRPGSIFLLNSIYGPGEVWEHLPREVQEGIIEKQLKFFVIDAYEVAKNAKMGTRINTIMQTCFFAISGVLPREQAIEQIKKAIKKTYSKFGEAVVNQNFEAVDHSLAHLHEVQVPDKVTSTFTRRPPVSDKAPEFVRRVLAPMMIHEGEALPVSALPIDGTFPTGTTQWEKRNVTLEIPAWDPEVCIQCGKCAFVCPHGVIRMSVYDPSLLSGAPEGFLSTDTRAAFKKFFPGQKFTLQVAPEDCTGCALCVEACPAKNKQQAGLKAINMVEQLPIRERERANWDFFLTLPEPDRLTLDTSTVATSQLLTPLFEFSGACAGCGETPYVKLISQLFGDRMIVANATGCSSIYGGNLPTTPWTTNREGRGPTWSNSLFEDNAEFGLGMRLTVDKHNEYARELVQHFASQLGDTMVQEVLNADQSTEAGIKAQRDRVVQIKQKMEGLKEADPRARDLLSLADYLVRKSVWIMGGDGWAYDIGYGGLDHVLASGKDINVLVMDTEVYSNTGGQSSKATPRGAVARFAAEGKNMAKKDLGMIAMAYGYVYVARVAMGYDDRQTLLAIQEAEAYPGPSLVIAYTQCIAHGINMRKGLEQQKLAVQAGYWPLYRFNPELVAQGQNPFKLESKAPSIPMQDYAYNEARYKVLVQNNEERAEMLMRLAQEDVNNRWKLYENLVTAYAPKE